MNGTPGFSGERLREARESRGLSVIQLSELIGVTKQAVNMYERSEISPADGPFSNIADGLRFPKQFFLREPSRPPEGPIFYRSLKSATRLMRSRAERRYGWFVSLNQLVSRHVSLPEAAVLDCSPPPDPSEISPAMVESLATQVRRDWKMGDGVIANVVALLESKGVPVAAHDMDADELDAFSNWYTKSKRPFVVLGTDKSAQVRSRFNAAHELGHLVLHRNVPLSILESPTAFKQIEEQANRFAGAFLLPATTFGREYIAPTLKSLLDIKRKWRVSIGAILFRAASLKQLDSDQVKRLMIARSRNGWNKQEPFDDEWEVEKPSYLSKSIQLIVESGVLSRKEMMESLALYADDFESVAGLPRGYMDEPASGVEEADDQSPRLLPFPKRHGTKRVN